MANRDPIRFIVLPPDWLTDTDELVRRTPPAVLGTDAKDYPNRHKNQRLPTGRILAENGERCSDASGLFPAAIVVPRLARSLIAPLRNGLSLLETIRLFRFFRS